MITLPTVRERWHHHRRAKSATCDGAETASGHPDQRFDGAQFRATTGAGGYSRNDGGERFRGEAVYSSSYRSYRRTPH